MSVRKNIVNKFMKEKIKKSLIIIENLSETSEVKLKKISLYIKQNLLPYEKQDDEGKRYFDKNKSLKRLKKIKELEKEGHTVKEMQEYFKWKDIYAMLDKFKK